MWENDWCLGLWSTFMVGFRYVLRRQQNPLVWPHTNDMMASSCTCLQDSLRLHYWAYWFLTMQRHGVLVTADERIIISGVSSWLICLNSEVHRPVAIAFKPETSLIRPVPNRNKTPRSLPSPVVLKYLSADRLLIWSEYEQHSSCWHVAILLEDISCHLQLLRLQYLGFGHLVQNVTTSWVYASRQIVPARGFCHLDGFLEDCRSVFRNPFGNISMQVEYQYQKSLTPLAKTSMVLSLFGKIVSFDQWIWNCGF